MRLAHQLVLGSSAAIALVMSIYGVTTLRQREALEVPPEVEPSRVPLVARHLPGEARISFGKQLLVLEAAEALACWVHLPHIARLHAYTPGLQPTEPGWIRSRIADARSESAVHRDGEQRRVCDGEQHQRKGKAQRSRMSFKKPEGVEPTDTSAAATTGTAPRWPTSTTMDSSGTACRT